MRLDRLEKKHDPEKRSVLLEPAFALGALLALVTSITLYVLISALGSPVSREELLDILPSSIALFIALVSLLITYKALIEQTKSRQAGTDPVVLVHLGHREDAPILVMLEVENVGAGAARNISLQFEDIDLDQMVQEGRFVSDLRRLRSPISVLPQDKKISYTMNTGPALFQPTILSDFRVRVTYSDVDGGQYSSLQRISVSELMEQSAHKSPLALIAEKMEKMEGYMKKIASSEKKFFVVSQDIGAFRDERASEREQIKEMLAKQGKE